MNSLHHYAKQWHLNIIYYALPIILAFLTWIDNYYFYMLSFYEPSIVNQWEVTIIFKVQSFGD